jgi:TPR repeat protein
VPKAQFGFWLLSREQTEYLERAAIGGVVEAQFEMALQGSRQARELCIAAADRGDVKALELAGVLLTREDPKDTAKGESYLRTAAEKGSSEAMALLAEHVEARNPKEAMELWETAANAGNRIGLFGYGTQLILGRLVERNLGKAFRFMKEAADRGYMPAQLTLCQMYAEGMGCERDIAKAGELAELLMMTPIESLHIGVRTLLHAQPDLKVELEKRNKSRAK